MKHYNFLILLFFMILTSIIIGLIFLSGMNITSCQNESPIKQDLEFFTPSVEVKNCPNEMVKIVGDYCTNLQEVCLYWLDSPISGEPLRCGKFQEPTVCMGKRKHMEFCIDQYEYPNLIGVKPSLQNTWYQARDKCSALGKRLCMEDEWTQACRGPKDLPYPYGYERKSVCRIDLPWLDPTTHTFEQLDKTVESGSMSGCVSEYGVYDLTGNADEYTISIGNSPYRSILKGGHPHGVRNRCSPRTTAHNEDFSFYVTGFRCCKDLDKDSDRKDSGK